MQRVAFKMQLHSGYKEEYKKRHSALWPEVESLLKSIGISEYSIFLDEETSNLIGILKVPDAKLINTLTGHPVMQAWWAYMKDIMPTNPDDSPVSVSLKEVFYLA